MTMKMMSSTSKISISGTTFISAIAPPLLSPTDIPIANLLSACVSRALQAIKPRHVGSGAAFLTQQTNGANTSPTSAERLSSGFNRPPEQLLHLEAEAVPCVLDSVPSKGRVGQRRRSGSRPQPPQRPHTWPGRRSSRKQFYRDGRTAYP